MKAILYIALLLGLAVPGLAEAREMHVCFTSIRDIGSANGYKNFEYRGRVWGDDPRPGYGYWVVARDTTFTPEPTKMEWAYYVQEAFVPDGASRGDVRFGVDNNSAYPLRFMVVRPANAAVSNQLRLRNRRGGFIQPQEWERTEVVSAEDGCIVELASLDGAPDGRACRCPEMGR